MQDLQTDLMNVQLGWSVKTAICQRAEAILELEENSPRAYELSLDIEQLQDLDAELNGLHRRTGTDEQEEWMLRRHLWARLAIRAYRVERSFWMPIGSTSEAAAAEARRIFVMPTICEADVACATHPVVMPLAAE